MSGAGLAWTGGIGAACAAAAVFSFDPLRRRIPAIFEYRRLLSGAGTHRDALGHRVYAPPNPSRRLLGWVGPCASLELRTLARTHGLDAALHLRFLRLLVLLFLSATFLTALPLAATFFTAKGLASGLQRVSIARVPDADAFRLWLAPVFQLLVSALAVALTLREATVFVQLRTRYRQSRNPANYALLAGAVPATVRSHRHVREFWQDNAEGVIQTYALRKADNVARAKAKFWEAVEACEVEEWQLRDLDAKSVTPLRERQNRAAGEVDFAQEAVEAADFRGGEKAAIIVFSSRTAATDAAARASAGEFAAWKVQRAPEPAAVNWQALSIAPEHEVSRVLLVCLLCALIALVWTVITAALAGLSNLDELVELRIGRSRPFSFARQFARQVPIVRGFAQGFVPAALLSLTLLLAPRMHHRFGAMCRTSSLGRRDAVARNSYFAFLVWVVAIAGAAAGAVTAIAHSARSHTADMAALIAAAIPAHAGFIMNFVMLQALFGASFTLLQVARVLGRRRRIARARTTREIRRANDWRGQYRFVEAYAFAQLVAFLGVVYAPIAPAVTACSLIYFAAVFPVAKYNLCYSNKAVYEGGGELFKGAVHSLLASLTTAHVLLAALLGLRGAIGPTVIAGVAIFPLIGAHWFIIRRMVLGESAESLNNEDNSSNETGPERKAPGALATVYVQPEMQPLPDPVENLSGAKTGDGSGGEEASENFSNFEEEEVAKAVKTYQVPNPSRTSGVVLPPPTVSTLGIDRPEDGPWYAARDSSTETSNEGRSYDWHDSRSSLGGVPFFQNSSNSRGNGFDGE